MAKKTGWSLVPDDERAPAINPTTRPVPTGNSREEREIRKKFEINSAVEAYKGIETLQAGEIVDALNEDLMADGADLIDFGVAIAKEDRDPDAQAMVEQFEKKIVNKALNDHTRTTNIGIQGVQETLRRPLNPEPRKKRFWE